MRTTGSSPSSEIDDSDRIARILFEQWDPLGIRDIAPADEYEEYALKIEAMLSRGEAFDDVCAYLDRTRTEVLLVPKDQVSDDRATHAILDLPRG